MKKSKSPSFCLTLKLNTSASDEQILMKRFSYGCDMYNKLVKHARKSLSGLRQNKEYRQLMSDRISADITARKSIDKKLSEMRLSYGLSEYQFHSWISVQQHRYKNHIDSLTAQKIASEVWNAVNDCLFNKGKSVRFKRFDDFYSLEGKNNSSGIRYIKGRIEWKGLVIYPQIRHSDDYAKKALTHKVKYCRIVRKPMGTKWHWYVQLVLEGLPPQKHLFLSNGAVGIDPGISTEAVVAPDKCLLVQLAPERKNIEDEIVTIQQRMDRSRRATNPDNFNSDGTVKRYGRTKWVKSSAYRKDQMRLKTLKRRNAESARKSEEKLANVILCEYGSDIITEKMNYSALSKKSEESHIDKLTGKYSSRKRYGKSIGYHAPARFISILNRKLSYIGKSVTTVDMYSYRASQYNHITDEYIKSDISERWKTIGDNEVQRDLYSAFLLMCAKDKSTIDKDKCNLLFPQFIKNHNQCIKVMKDVGISRPATFGF